MRTATHRPLPAATGAAARRATANVGAETVDSLLMRVGGGDRSAFDALYDAVAPAVFATAMRVVRDRHLAEDVAQEALVEIWRQAARFDRRRGSAMTWVMMIAYRRAVDHVRAGEARNNREARAGSSDSWCEPDFDERLASRERGITVTTALVALPTAQRDAVHLAFYGGCTHRQVADRLRIPLGTAKSRIRLGLVNMRDAMLAPAV